MDSEDSVSTASSLSSPDAVDPVGRMLGGKYQVLALLGRGGIGAVYRVRQIFLNKDMALKLLDSDKVADTAQIRRFEQEARAAYSLNHPSLVKVHDFGLQDTGQPYLVMDLLEGETLAAYLKGEGAMTLKNINAVFAQVCFALSYAHSEKVIHRDIKPSNIMLLQGMSIDTEGSVKIIDLGLAKWLTEGAGMQGLTRTGEIIGSPIYMSPEQCSGEALDHRSDIYSLGCVLFEALSGTPPFIGETSLRTMMLHQSGTAPTLREASLGKEFSPGLEGIVAKMLAKSPSDRYQDLGVVAHELALVCRGSERALEPKRLSPAPAPTQSSKPKLEPKEDMRTFTFTPLTLVLLNGCTIFLTAATTLLVMQSNLITRAQQGSTAQVQPVSAPPEQQKTPAVVPKHTQSEDIPSVSAPIISKTVSGTDGKEVREFQFPKASIGRVCDQWKFFLSGKHSHGDKVRFSEAKSKVDCPTDLPLTLEINVETHPALINCADVYKAIGPKEFVGLVLKRENTEVEETSIVEPRFLASVIEQAAGWKHLQALGLANLEVQRQEIEALDKIKSLKVFDDDRLTLDPDALDHSTFLQRIEICRAWDTIAEGLTRHLKGSTKLTTVVFIQCHCTGEALEFLRSCPNLRTIVISQEEIYDSIITALLTLHQVRYITIGEPSTAQIKLLLSSPSLVELRVSSDTKQQANSHGITDRRLIADDKHELVSR